MLPSSPRCRDHCYQWTAASEDSRCQQQGFSRIASQWMGQPQIQCRLFESFLCHPNTLVDQLHTLWSWIEKRHRECRISRRLHQSVQQPEMGLQDSSVRLPSLANTCDEICWHTPMYSCPSGSPACAGRWKCTTDRDCILSYRCCPSISMCSICSLWKPNWSWIQPYSSTLFGTGSSLWSQIRESFSSTVYSYIDPTKFSFNECRLAKLFPVSLDMFAEAPVAAIVCAFPATVRASSMRMKLQKLLMIICPSTLEWWPMMT